MYSSSTNNGYVILHIPDHHRAWKNGFVYEHIVVAESKYGMKITRDIAVHHIDGNRANNSPENLEVLSHSDHAKRHSKVQETSTINLKCDYCGITFNRKRHNRKEVKGYSSNFCSRRCNGLKSTMKKTSLAIPSPS
jgi:aspartate carbamoyltransferase regulatory subunit